MDPQDELSGVGIAIAFSLHGIRSPCSESELRNATSFQASSLTKLADSPASSSLSNAPNLRLSVTTYFASSTLSLVKTISFAAPAKHDGRTLAIIVACVVVIANSKRRTFVSNGGHRIQLAKVLQQISESDALAHAQCSYLTMHDYFELRCSSMYHQLREGRVCDEFVSPFSKLCETDVFEEV
jgi:hypothetical protein